MSIAIIDYGSGNLRSVAKAFERAASEAGADQDICVTSDPADLAAATHIVLPGVGAFADCRAGLTAVDGMEDALNEAVGPQAKPFLGICVGMQLMADRGLEHGSTDGFGWIPGEVRALALSDPTLKVPHMGWNNLHFPAKAHPVLEGIPATAHAYFVHSFAFVCADSEHEIATTDYGGPITAAIGRDNMVGAQFHPEKSQSVGLRLIANFLEWRP